MHPLAFPSTCAALLLPVLLWSGRAAGPDCWAPILNSLFPSVHWSKFSPCLGGRGGILPLFPLLYWRGGGCSSGCLVSLEEEKEGGLHAVPLGGGLVRKGCIYEFEF